jgi:hypothetical protein
MLANNSLKVFGADSLEQVYAFGLNMLGVEEPGMALLEAARVASHNYGAPGSGCPTFGLPTHLFV